MSDYIYCTECGRGFLLKSATTPVIPAHSCVETKCTISGDFYYSNSDEDEKLNKIIRLLKQIEYNTRK